MENKSQITVLYVDDEENNLISFKAIFRKYFTVFTANSGNEAKKLLTENDIHVLITDQRMPEMTGVELLANSLSKYPDQIRILLTGYKDIELLKEAANKHFIFKYLEKPWNEEELRRSIEDAEVLYLKQKVRNVSLYEQKKSELEFLISQLELELLKKTDDIKKIFENDSVT